MATVARRCEGVGAGARRSQGEYSAMERSIDVQISRLRRMVEEDPAHPRYIQTVWGLGYVFVPDGSKA